MVWAKLTLTVLVFLELETPNREFFIGKFSCVPLRWLRLKRLFQQVHGASWQQRTSRTLIFSLIGLCILFWAISSQVNALPRSIQYEAKLLTSTLEFQPGHIEVAYFQNLLRQNKSLDNLFPRFGREERNDRVRYIFFLASNDAEGLFFDLRMPTTRISQSGSIWRFRREDGEVFEAGYLNFDTNYMEIQRTRGTCVFQTSAAIECTVKFLSDRPPGGLELTAQLQ